NTHIGEQLNSPLLCLSFVLSPTIWLPLCFSPSHTHTHTHTTTHTHTHTQPHSPSQLSSLHSAGSLAGCQMIVQIPVSGVTLLSSLLLVSFSLAHLSQRLQSIIEHHR